MTREQLIEQLDSIVPKKPKSDWSKYQREVVNATIKALEQEPGWISVSERLPESDGHYLVTEKSGRVCTYVFHKEGNSEEYWKRCAVAWMPLSHDCVEEQEPTAKNDLALIHTEGLDEEIRCTMCTNHMKSDRGCDGSCVVNKDMYKAVMEAIEKRIQPTTKNDLDTINGLNDFIEFGKKAFGVELTIKKSDNPDTYEKLFAKWVATEIFDDMWEYNTDAFAEIACRKLAKLGIVRAKGGKWELVEPQESEDKG